MTQILALGGTMYFQKLSSLGLAVLASLSLVAPSVATRGHQMVDQSVETTTGTWVADGGAPVPPVPTKPPANYTIADGGAPVPPVPPKQPQPSIADGGAPVPPLPPGPKGQLASFVV